MGKLPTASALSDRMRLKQLRLVSALGDQGSLRRAAAKLNVTQPTATKMLAELEAGMGFALYERRPRGLQITPLGREVLSFAARVLSELDRLLAALEARQSGGVGELTVGAILGATPDVIAQAVLDMKEAWPRLTIKLRGESSDHVLQLLEARRVDVAVGRFHEATQHNLYHYEPLGKETLCVVARTGHALARRSRLGFAELAEERWVVQSMATPARQILEGQFARAGLRSPQDMIEANSILTMIQLVERSDAIAMLSEPLVRDHLTAKLLCQLPIQIDAQLSGFGILTRSGEQLQGVSAEFAERLRQIARRDSGRESND